MDSSRYQFLQPARARLTRPDGSTVLMGYGIGDCIDVVYAAIEERDPMSDPLSDYFRRGCDPELADGATAHFDSPPWCTICREAVVELCPLCQRPMRYEPGEGAGKGDLWVCERFPECAGHYIPLQFAGLA